MISKVGMLILVLTLIPVFAFADRGQTTFDEFGHKTDSPENPVDSPQHPTEASKMFSVMLGAGLGQGNPTGGFYDGFDKGLLYYGDLRLAV